MIFLKKLILENEEEINSNLWTDWTEYISEIEYDIPLEEIKKLIKRFDIQFEKYFEKIACLFNGNEKIYLLYDPKNKTLDYIKDIFDWIYQLNDYEMENLLGLSIDKIYNGWTESTLEDMAKDPGKLYHYTTEDKWQEIQESGILKTSYGSGLTNQGTSGIFTSVSPETYADGVYGNVCLEIDVSKFIQSNNIPAANLEYEPSVAEYLLRTAIRDKMNLENEMNIEMDYSSGDSPYTIIVGHKIPIQFVRRLK